MIDIISTIVVLCLLVEVVLIFQYGYSLLISLNSNIFNGLTKALSVRFFGSILLHSYLAVSLIWSFFLSGDKGYNAVLLFLMILFMILTLLASINSYFYYLIRKQQIKDDNETLRDNEPGSDTGIEPVN